MKTGGGGVGGAFGTDWTVLVVTGGGIGDGDDQYGPVGAEGAADAAAARLHAAGPAGAAADARSQPGRFAAWQPGPLGDERRLSGARHA